MTEQFITFDQARAIGADESAAFSPFSVLNESGRAKVKAFADEFYSEDGEPSFYDEAAVFTEFERGAEDLLAGYNHIVELRRVNCGLFGGFKVDTLELGADDFDWLIYG